MTDLCGIKVQGVLYKWCWQVIRYRFGFMEILVKGEGGYQAQSQPRQGQQVVYKPAVPPSTFYSYKHLLSM